MSFKKYMTRPVVKEAQQWHGSLSQGHKLAHAVGGKLIIAPHGRRIEIPTLEGVMYASPGDYIVKGVHEEFYSCKPDIFEKTYKRIE